MVRGKTLIVVGAGASAEFGLPTGADLRDEIGRRLDIRFEDGTKLISGNAAIVQAIQNAVREKGERGINPHLYAAWAIRDAMPQAISIDNFLDSRAHDEKIELCGKLAIASAILDAEQRSILFFNSQNSRSRLNFKRAMSTWASQFVQILFESCRREGLSERLSSLVLIVFNYDRCVEHYLFHSLQNYYGIPAAEASELVGLVEVFHPFGQVGYLPWQQRRPVAGFGSQSSGVDLLSLSSGIRTFTEGTDPEGSDINAIRERIANSEILLFLGFGFHPLNMELLKSDADAGVQRRCFATALGISDYDCKALAHDIESLTRGGFAEVVLRNDLSCHDLFREYWRTLSLS